nr:immunoglobulin heavy chain junction region [Macaca mulatta]
CVRDHSGNYDFW